LVAPTRHRPLVAEAAFPGFLVLAIGLSLALAGDLGWRPTLLLGVATAGAVFGAGLAILTRYLGMTSPEVWLTDE
jgi:hypothetical protein